MDVENPGTISLSDEMTAISVLAGLAATASAFTLPMAGGVAYGSASRADARMMFGGGGGGKDDEGGFMDKIKQASQMFNPEMMKKYTEVGIKVQELQKELAETEVECATKDGGVTVKVSGTQVPSSVTVSAALCESGAEAVSAELTSALKSAHAKSGAYAQQRMASLYEDMGLNAGMAGIGDKPPGQ